MKKGRFVSALRNSLFLSSTILGTTLSMILSGCYSGSMQDFEDGDAAISALTAVSGPRGYIVRLKEGVDIDTTLDDLNLAHGAGVTHRYRNALRGGTLLVANEAARERIAQDPRVESIEADQPVFASQRSGGNTSTPPAQTLPTGYRLIGSDLTSNEGTGLRVAVLDSGVDFDHSDLVSNMDMSLARDCVNESGAPFDDGNGHGTHVAGTIAATNNSIGSVGVGTGIQIVPVKVLNRRGSGSWSSIICGIDHLTANAGAIPVANLSLGGAGSECIAGTGCTKSALQLAVERAVAAGVTLVVAAGNDGVNAATQIPAAYDVVITVSAYKDSNGTLSSDDGWASFTNFGSDVDLAAPGVNIYSTWKANGYNTISGTSMAAPHVAAAAALYLAVNPGASPAQVRDGLRALARSTYPGSTDSRHAEPLLDISAL
jgi:subtilisin